MSHDEMFRRFVNLPVHRQAAVAGYLIGLCDPTGSLHRQFLHQVVTQAIDWQEKLVVYEERPPRTASAQLEARIVALTQGPPPCGQKWSTRTLAAVAGTYPMVVHRVWCRMGFTP